MEEHRRRIYTEEKSKVFAAVCGAELIQFLACTNYFAPEAEYLITNEWDLTFKSYLGLGS